jgi:Holliday junction resolvase RusA-like endonuclease
MITVPESTLVEFFVPGTPRTAGSKTAFLNKKTGKINMAPANKKTPLWSAEVKSFAMKAWGKPPIVGKALGILLEFRMARPKYHYNTKGAVKPNAPQWPTGKKPDVTKMVRCIEDALNNLIWHDDSQVVVQVNVKRYVTPDETPGVAISIHLKDEE